MAIYSARKPFDERWGQADVELLDENAQRQRAAERAQVEGSIQRQLGEGRYAEFQRGEDEDYHRLNALATRYKLPKEKAVEAYSYKKIVGDYRAQVRADGKLNAQQKQEALHAINTETEQALRGLLGDRAYRYYARTGQGGWVRE